MLLVSGTGLYAQNKGKNIAKAVEAAVSGKVPRAAVKTPKMPQVPVAKTPTIPQTPALHAATVTPKTVPVTKPKAVRAAKYPINETREEFLARWNAMTFEEQLADYREFQKIDHNFEMQLARAARDFVKRGEEDEYRRSPQLQKKEKILREGRGLRDSVLTEKHVEHLNAISIAGYARSAEEFEALMEESLSPSLLVFLDWSDSSITEEFAAYRRQALKRAGQEGNEHPVTPQEQKKYAQAIRKILSPTRMHERTRVQMTYILQERAPSYSLPELAKRIETFNFSPNPCFVDRQTGKLGLVFEVPAVTIDDGVNPVQVLDPETQVLFFAADPISAEAIIYVEERAKFEDPYAYNLVSPHTQKLAAEQPMPANAAQPADPNSYAELRKKVTAYREKYYDPK